MGGEWLVGGGWVVGGQVSGWWVCKPILLFSLAQAEQKTERDMCKTGQKVCCGSVTGSGVVGWWVGGWLVGGQVSGWWVCIPILVFSLAQAEQKLKEIYAKVQSHQSLDPNTQNYVTEKKNILQTLGQNLSI